MTSTPAGRQGFFLLSSKNISLKKGDEALQDGVKRDYGVTGQLKSLPENHA